MPALVGGWMFLYPMGDEGPGIDFPRRVAPGWASPLVLGGSGNI